MTSHKARCATTKVGCISPTNLPDDARGQHTSTCMFTCAPNCLAYASAPQCAYMWWIGKHEHSLCITWEFWAQISCQFYALVCILLSIIHISVHKCVKNRHILCKIDVPGPLCHNNAHEYCHHLPCQCCYYFLHGRKHLQSVAKVERLVAYTKFRLGNLKYATVSLRIQSGQL